MSESRAVHLCDTWIDPSYLDEVIYHATRGCMDPEAEKPSTGIRGVLVDEPPQA